MRQKRGITQEQLAEMADISTRSLSGIELGENFLTAQTLENILRSLDINIEELFASDHLKSTEDLLTEIHTMVDKIKYDRDQVENIYKIIKAILVI